MSDVYFQANVTSLRNFTDLVFNNITRDALFSAHEVSQFWKQPIIIATLFGELLYMDTTPQGFRATILSNTTKTLHELLGVLTAGVGAAAIALL